MRIEVTTLLSTEPEGSKTFVTKLLHSIEGRTGTIKEVAALSVAFLGVLGLTTRYVLILDVALSSLRLNLWELGNSKIPALMNLVQ